MITIEDLSKLIKKGNFRQFLELMKQEECQTVALREVMPDSKKSVLHLIIEYRPETSEGREKRKEVLNRILKLEGVKVNLQDGGGKTPIYIAVESQDEGVVEMIFGCKKNITVYVAPYDPESLSPIELAARLKSYKILKIICEGTGANIDNYFADLLRYNYRDDNIDLILEFLKNYIADIKESNSPNLALSAFIDDSEYKKELLRSALSTASEESLNNFLIASVLDNSLDLVKLSVQDGSEVNAQDALGRTPLDLAIKNGHGSIAQFLVQNNVQGNAPLHALASRLTDLSELEKENEGRN